MIQVQHKIQIMISGPALSMSKVGYRIGPHFQKGSQIDKKKFKDKILESQSQNSASLLNFFLSI